MFYHLNFWTSIFFIYQNRNKSYFFLYQIRMLLYLSSSRGTRVWRRASGRRWRRSEACRRTRGPRSPSKRRCHAETENRKRYTMGSTQFCWGFDASLLKVGLEDRIILIYFCYSSFIFLLNNFFHIFLKVAGTLQLCPTLYNPPPIYNTGVQLL